MTRILGIDPGSQRTGIGIIDAEPGGGVRHVFHTALQLLDNETFPLRLKQIFDEVCAAIAQHRPEEVAIERVFMARNPDSALKLGQARGAAICAAVHSGLAVTEYAAKEIKRAVVGSGGAGKQQVQHMIGIRCTGRRDHARAHPGERAAHRHSAQRVEATPVTAPRFDRHPLRSSPIAQRRRP
jgi:crossover junction endodeoxyribonuclease RuvC